MLNTKVKSRVHRHLFLHNSISFLNVHLTFCIKHPSLYTYFTPFTILYKCLSYFLEKIGERVWNLISLVCVTLLFTFLFPILFCFLLKGKQASKKSTFYFHLLYYTTIIVTDLFFFFLFRCCLLVLRKRQYYTHTRIWRLKVDKSNVSHVIPFSI